MKSSCPQQKARFRIPANFSLSTLLLLACLTGGGPVVSAFSAESPALILHPAAQVRGDGIFLHQLVANTNALPGLPNVRLANAPAFGKSLFLTKDHIMGAWKMLKPEEAKAWTNWTGAARIHVTREARRLEEEEVRVHITRLLQAQHVRSQGTLELRLTRPWIPVGVPTEPIEFHITDLPAAGLSSFFLLRFEIRTESETVGLWQVPLQAKVWRGIWVTRAGIRRGHLFTDADGVQERRDLPALGEAPLSLARITAQLLEVPPDNNLVVEGRHRTDYAGQTQQGILRAIVRPEDIFPSNPIDSDNMAGSSIRFLPIGAQADGQEKGSFIRGWNKITLTESIRQPGGFDLDETLADQLTRQHGTQPENPQPREATDEQ